MSFDWINLRENIDKLLLCPLLYIKIIKIAMLDFIYNYSIIYIITVCSVWNDFYTYS